MSGPMQWSAALGKLIPVGSGIPQFDQTAQAPAPIQIILPADVMHPNTLSASIEAAVAAKPKKPAPQNIVALAKERLKEVKAELRRMNALEKERGELERLIAAAEDKKPRAPKLRAVKTSAQ